MAARTDTAARPEEPPADDTPSSRPSTPSGGRFLPGTVLLDRYRILCLLGKGGMGEVYRADDLKLGQPVALKFLPAELDENEERRRRFLNEVKVARQVTHPGVCRMYDVAEHEGRSFLSMEYVDGEDLAGLLRRIGRLPVDKAVQVARQICAGLAAAHDQGILHRDLKPANVMIDGRGRAKIMDFGLAGLAGEIEGAEIRAGTPAYMAPEQLAGEEVTVRSDLYALGLLLYEIFTGKPAFKAGSAAQLMALQESGPPASPSSHVEGLDPAVERILLKCLQRDPADRPGSALGVAAALPGGDPLAAALAAGETPSPELLAVAGAKGSLSPGAAWSCLGAFVIAALLIVLMSADTQITRRVPLRHSPAVLEAKAREILASVGHEGEPADMTSGFETDDDYFQRVPERDSSPERWKELDSGESPVLLFWYAESPRPLIPIQTDLQWSSPQDPPNLGTGMARVKLDTTGRLRYLAVVPPSYDHEEGRAPGPDWSPLFEASGLDPDRLTGVRPRSRPDVWVERREAWEGRYPGADDLEVRIEAGAVRGEPVYWQVLFPWKIPSPGTPRAAPGLVSELSGIVGTLFMLGGILSGAALARRNVKLGRGDHGGALRTATAILVARVLAWVLGGHHVAHPEETEMFYANLAQGLWAFGLSYVFYLAVEPYARRLWPERLVSWVRLLEGRIRDPLVGRDLLFGLLWGAGIAGLFNLYQLAPSWLGSAPPRPGAFMAPWAEMIALRGDRFVLALVAHAFRISLFHALLGTMVLLGLRLVLRRDWAALLAFAALGAFIMNPSAGNTYVDMTVGALYIALASLCLIRAGFLALLAGFFSMRLFLYFPQTFDLSEWYAQGSMLSLGILAVVAVYAFRTALAGRPLFKDEIA